MDYLNIKITRKYNNISVKEFLKQYHVGRATIEKIRVKKLVLLNQENTTLEAIIHEDDMLTFLLDEEVDFIPYDYQIEISYEDEYILMVNKPSGILIHPDNENNQKTLVNVIASYYLKNGIHRKVRYAHRIDFDTSGIVVFAKDFITLSMLNHLVETHDLKRYYLALCHNRFNSLKGIINRPIGKDRHQSNKYRVSDSPLSKTAHTHFQVIKQFSNYALVKLRLEEGRTHQIRVHMSYVQHPLLGDELYGGKKNLISRTALHSYQVEFIHPITNQVIKIIQDLPHDMKKLVGDYKND